MKDLSKKTTKSKDILLYFIILAVTSLVIGISYVYPVSSSVKIIIWIGWLIVIATMLFFTEAGQSLFLFSKEAKTELSKVVWPTKQETMQTTLLVVAMVSIASIVLWSSDSLMMWLVARITQLG